MAKKQSSRKSKPSVMDRIAAPVLWARVWIVRVFLIVVVIVCGTVWRIAGLLHPTRST